MWRKCVRRRYNRAVSDTAGQRTLAEIAQMQWGLVSTRQAEAAGVPRLQLSRLAQRGLLARVAQGVYRVAGAPESQHQAILAAWLALADPTRPSALVVGGAAAAQLHGSGQLWRQTIDLLVPERRRSRREGVRFRRVRLGDDEIITTHGVPTLTPAATIADLLEQGESPDNVADAAIDALGLGIATGAQIRQAVAARVKDVEMQRMLAQAVEERLRGRSPISTLAA